MRFLPCTLLVGTLGCKMDNPAFGRDTDDASGSGASASGSTSDTGSTASDTKASDTQSSDTQSSTGATTDSGATSSGTGPDTAGTTDATTGAGSGSTGFVACDPFPEHGDIAVQLLENGNPVDTCGDTFSISGVVTAEGDVWTISSCQGDPTSCDCPDGQLTQLKFVVPAVWPQLVPDAVSCARVQVAYDADCNFSSAAVNQIEGINIIERPHWLANGVGLMPSLGGNPSISITPKLDRPCDCEGNCCGVQPGEYKLSVSGLSFDGEPYLYPGDNKEALTPGSNSYNIANSASYVNPLCGDPPVMRWIAKFNVPG